MHATPAHQKEREADKRSTGGRNEQKAPSMPSFYVGCTQQDRHWVYGRYLPALRWRVPEHFGPQEEAPLRDDQLAGRKPTAHGIDVTDQGTECDDARDKPAFLPGTGMKTTCRAPIV